MIDTGATNSFLNPDLAEKYYPDKIEKERFVLTTMFNKSNHDSCVNIQILDSSKFQKFYLVKFHNYFDGLIGSETLRSLQANINYLNNTITLNNQTYDLLWFETQSKPIYQTTLSPKQKDFFKIPVTIKKGDLLIPEQKIGNALIPNCITSAKNYSAKVPIINTEQQEVQFTLEHPIAAQTYSDKIFHCYQNQNISEIGDQDISELIRTSHMTDVQRKVILNLCNKFKDIFYKPGDNLTFTNKIKHKINLTDDTPIYTKSYRYPFVHKQEVQNQMQKMLEQGIIRPSSSPWSSPIWIVPKRLDASGEKKWRVVVDYRKLNEKTIPDRYPIPNITDVLNKLGNSTWFSTIDLASGFHQIEVDEKDIPKTAFNTENGHYEFLRMPFGLRNSPSTFERVIESVLRGLNNNICLVYMDDIIIMGKSFEDHIKNVKLVFERLREANFKIQLDKSEFLRTEVAYLGHVICPEGIKPNAEKIKAIKNFPIPSTQKQLKSFLGLLNYYRKFIKDFAKLTKPLTMCLKKNATVKHSPEFINCFENCKKLLLNDPILQYPNFEKEFLVTTDASAYAIGAILSQGPIGTDKPVSYISRTLNNHEVNYSTVERELLAIVWAVKQFRPYLYGRRFKIITDHMPLKYLFNLKEANSRLIRWRLKLEEFDYEVVYKKGTQNSNADALSRIELHNDELRKYIEQFNKDLASENTENHDNASIIVNVDQNDTPNLPEQDDSQSNQTSETNHTSDENTSASLPITEKAINFYHNQFLIQISNISPNLSKKTVFGRPQYFVTLTRNNFETELVNVLKQYMKPNVINAIYLFDLNCLEITSETIRKHFTSEVKFILSKSLKTNVTSEISQTEKLIQFHEANNHRGATELEKEIRSKYYWPTLRLDCQKFVDNCQICQSSKYERHPSKLKLQITPTPSKPFEFLFIDVFSIGSSKFLTCIDQFSKFAIAKPITSTNSLDVISALLDIISTYNIPNCVTTDNGPEFSNNNVSEFFKYHKIEHHFTTPLHHRSNSPVERLHSTLIEMIRVLKIKSPNDTIENLVKYAILGYNQTIHSATNHKPVELLTGHFSKNDIFETNNNQKFITNYLNEHKAKVNDIYELVQNKIISDKEKTINQRNQSLAEPDTYLTKNNDDIFVDQNPRNKSKPKYKKHKIISESKSKVKTSQNKTYHKYEIKPLRRSKRLQKQPSFPDYAENDDNIPDSDANLVSCSSTENRI